MCQANNEQQEQEHEAFTASAGQEQCGEAGGVHGQTYAGAAARMTTYSFAYA